jgi:mannose-6-phosphate isomerase-like protein (cupin superfamily)
MQRMDHAVSWQGMTRPRLGTCELEPLNHIASCAHPDVNELMFFYRGWGEAVIDGSTYSIHPEMAIYVPVGVEHELWNTATDEPLCFVWIHVLECMGKKNAERVAQGEVATGEGV